MRNFRESPKGEVPRIPIPKLFDNSKLFLVWAPTSEQKRLKRSHFVVLKATGSRSEGLQRFIKQFLEGQFSEVGRCLYCYLSPRYISGGDMFSLFLKVVGKNVSSSERASEKGGDSRRYERCYSNRDQRCLGYEL